jgi:hypothetical protein
MVVTSIADQYLTPGGGVHVFLGVDAQHNFSGQYLEIIPLVVSPPSNSTVTWSPTPTGLVVLISSRRNFPTIRQGKISPPSSRTHASFL